jgi:putative flippase GtrA
MASRENKQIFAVDSLPRRTHNPLIVAEQCTVATHLWQADQHRCLYPRPVHLGGRAVLSFDALTPSVFSGMAVLRSKAARRSFGCRSADGMLQFAELPMAEFVRVVRFIVVGGVNTAFGYASYALFVACSMPLWLALVASMVAAFVFNFFTYGGLVFKDVSRRNLPRFLAFYTAFATVNYGALRILDALGIKPMLGQALLLPLLAVTCYAGLQLFVFRASASAGR